MRAASSPLITLLNTGTQFRIADLLTIVLADGTKIRMTSADLDITAVSRLDNASHVFSCAGPAFKRARTKMSIGLESSTLALSIFPRAGDTVAGAPWPSAAEQGILDEATVMLERAFMPTWGDTSAGTVILFSGRVGQIEPFRNEIQIEVLSDLELLGTSQLPRNVYQPGCLYTLFDAGCGLNRASFELACVANSGCTKSILQATLGTLPAGVAASFTYTPVGGGDPVTMWFDDYYELGMVRFTSGQNIGLQRSIKSWRVLAQNTIALMRPLPYVTAPGDTFVMTPGCDKRLTYLGAQAGDVRYGTCTAKFANFTLVGGKPVPNGRGFPFVPTPENSL